MAVAVARGVSAPFLRDAHPTPPHTHTLLRRRFGHGATRAHNRSRIPDSRSVAHHGVSSKLGGFGAHCNKVPLIWALWTATSGRRQPKHDVPPCSALYDPHIGGMRAPARVSGTHRPVAFSQHLKLATARCTACTARVAQHRWQRRAAVQAANLVRCVGRVARAVCAVHVRRAAGVARDAKAGPGPPSKGSTP